MGTTVLDAGPSREGLHLYAHCLRGKPGGVAFLAINNSRSAPTALTLNGPGERYTLSAPDLQSVRIQLNGAPIQLGREDELPVLSAVAVKPGNVELAPATITFLTVPSAGNPQCLGR